MIVVLFGGGLAGAVVSSVTPLTGVGRGTVTLAPWRALLGDPAFGDAVLFTARIAVLATTLSAALALVVALILRRRGAALRSLAALPEPDLMLLDEPLGALDPDRRAELRRLVVDVQRERGLTTLMVTHDQAEAAELGRRVALMLEGRVVGYDEPRALFERPASAAVARFFGMSNLLHGTVHDGRIELGGGALVAGGPDGTATVGVRPEHVELDDASDIRAVVQGAAYTGSHVRLTLDCAGRRLEARVLAPCGAGPGDEVGLRVAPGRVWRLPDTQGATASAPPGRSADPR